jgi:caffeoyl-CoA O-methyltransferase
MGNDPKGLGQSDPAIGVYLEGVFGPEDEILAEIRARSEREKLPSIEVARFDGRHLEVIARAVGARKIVEIGTLGGYSGVCLARSLPEEGTLDTFEYEPRHATVAEESFRRAGLGDRVKIHVGAALENLEKIEDRRPFDLVFIDADKVNYLNYLRWAASNLRKGGVVLADNVFRACETPGDNWSAESIAGLDRFNRELVSGGAFHATFIPTVEGLAMGVKA